MLFWVFILFVQRLNTSTVLARDPINCFHKQICYYFDYSYVLYMKAYANLP